MEKISLFKLDFLFQKYFQVLLKFFDDLLAQRIVEDIIKRVLFCFLFKLSGWFEYVLVDIAKYVILKADLLFKSIKDNSSNFLRLPFKSTLLLLVSFLTFFFVSFVGFFMVRTDSISAKMLSSSNKSSSLLLDFFVKSSSMSIN